MFIAITTDQGWYKISKPLASLPMVKVRGALEINHPFARRLFNAPPWPTPDGVSIGKPLDAALRARAGIARMWTKKLHKGLNFQVHDSATKEGVMMHLKIVAGLLAVGLLSVWLVATASARTGQVTGTAVDTSRTTVAEGVRRDQALFVWCDRFMKQKILPKIQELLVMYEKQAACWRDARAFGLRGHTVGSSMLDRTSKCRKIDAAVVRLQREGMTLLEQWSAKGCGDLKPKR